MATFVRVADVGSLSKAAQTFKVTPAAVSRQLTSLEAELGASLLTRTTRRIALTDEGRRFYEHAERTLHEAEEARAAVRADPTISGRVTISMPTALGFAGMHLSLADLVSANPGLVVDLRLEDHPVDLLADGIDVAVRAGLAPPDSATLVAQPLAMMERVIVAAPGYLRRRGEPSTPEALAKHDTVVHLHAGSGVGVWQLHAGDESRTVETSGRLRATALTAVREATVHEAGIALLPRFVVARELADKRLRALKLGGWQPRPQQIYALVRVESRNRARVRVVLEHARTFVRSLGADTP